MEGTVNYTPMRILMTTDMVGGVWSYSVALCRALLPFDVHFYLVTTGAPIQPAQKQEVEGLENVTVYETDFLLEWMDAPWQSIDASGAWLLQLEKALQPDLIHLNCYAYGSLPWKAPVMIMAHSDVWSWYRAVEKDNPPALWDEYFQRVKGGLQQADLVIAPSKTMMQYISTHYAVTAPGQVIHNSREAGAFYPGAKEPFVFSMGRIWDKAKNIGLLAEAAQQIHYPIRLAGDNSFAGNHCATSGPGIAYLGKLSAPEVAMQLSVASVYVLPAKYEPFGLSVLEAALSGCALVLGNIGSLQELWHDSAVYVDTDDAGALAEAVNYLMQHESVRVHYAQHAMEQAKKYSTAAMAGRYLQAYRSLLRRENHLLQGNHSR